MARTGIVNLNAVHYSYSLWQQGAAPVLTASHYPFHLLMTLALLVLCACGDSQNRGVIQGEALPQSALIKRQEQQLSAMTSQRAVSIGEKPESRILFGDLHVHTTFSPDAFIMSAPIMGGGGLRSPADACDYARYCSALDFWSINDHAEGITPRLWEETRKSIRECNDRASDPENPDLVAFLGWEWSQVSENRAQHYGHKNVIFRETADNSVPSRPIASPREQLGRAPMGKTAQLLLALADFENREFYYSIQRYYDEIAATPVCPSDINTRDLPTGCLELAADPRTLFTKLDQWGFDSIVIPHGTSWGINTPPLTSLDKQLNRQQHDPARQILFEIFSGHGNSEQYRDWRAIEQRVDGSLTCSAPSDNYLPCCWRAGEIIQERCAGAGLDKNTCESRAAQARQNFVDAGISGHLTIPGQEVTDWLNCGNCIDCFLGPMDHRPAASGQYALTRTNMDAQDDPLNFRFGFIGSTDNHRAMPGSGFKQVQRRLTTETFGASSERTTRLQRRDTLGPVPYSIPLDRTGVGLLNLRNMERQNSFWLSGGLAAVHSAARNRDAIWQGMMEREVYGTTGDRILLWFDLLLDDTRVPMGGAATATASPRFRVSAVGDFKQLPGCPQFAKNALGAERLQRLCGGECYNPSDERRRIQRIEVIRIKPQIGSDEPVGNLIQDPWMVLPCPDDPLGCTVEFEDKEFPGSQGNTVYYVRAIQEEAEMINAGNLRCEYSEQGECITVNPCYGDYRTSKEDDCLYPAAQRAWSSPIFVSYEPLTEQRGETVKP